MFTKHVERDFYYSFIKSKKLFCSLFFYKTIIEIKL